MENQTQQENKVLINRVNNSKDLTLQQIKCNGCKFITSLCDTTYCGRCDKTFCEDCSKITENCKCGNKKQSQNNEYYSQLEKIEISCKYESIGCENSVPYSNLITHESHCNFSPVKCELCLKIFFKEDFLNHGYMCPEMEIKCTKCSFTSKRKNHTPICYLENFFNLFVTFSLKEKLNLLIMLIKKIGLIQKITNINTNNMALFKSLCSIFEEISKADSIIFTENAIVNNYEQEEENLNIIKLDNEKQSNCLYILIY